METSAINRWRRLRLYVDTVRHLRAGQIAWRILHRIPKPPLSHRAAPPMNVPEGVWAAAIERPVAVLDADRFCYLNHEATLAFPEAWNDNALARLWLYNLHYFDDLSARGGKEHKCLANALVERWILENPPPLGVGWEPYPLSLRIVNWLKPYLGGQLWTKSVIDSLALQVRALEQRIERHILANHLFANGKALVFAGACFGGREGERWRAEGLTILAREIEEQVLEDGGHFERSPMYHAIILEDVLDLINLSRAYPHLFERQKVQWAEAANKMRAWLRAMSHPDGDIAFFNDCAFGVAATPSALEAYAHRLGLPPLGARSKLIDLEASGYVRTQAGSFTLFFDAAEIGPDYQPGHAHADALSLELSVGDTRLLVNGGVSTYEQGPQRCAERATAAHNTIEVDGEDSSEVWAAFRVARRARITSRSISTDDGQTILTASHDGYRRFGGKVICERTITCAPNQIRVSDRVTGTFSHAVTRFRLAPGLSYTVSDECRQGEVSFAGCPVARWSASNPGYVKQVAHASGFNVIEPATEIRFSVGRSGADIVWRALA